jgi:adenosylcobinamide-GDP ribazoletransferase
MSGGRGDIMARVWGDVLAAFGLLTRLPVPDHAPRGAAAAWAWPVAGAVVGALGALALQTAMWAGLTAGPAAALALAVMALATGGLHEDGLSDTADGLWGGHTPARRLEIMKDSRVGSYGVLALMLVGLARWSAVVALAEAGLGAAALVAAGALSRAPMAVVMAALPNARGTGLAALVGRPGGWTAAGAAALGLLLALAAAGPAVLAGALLAAALVAALARTARARIGGQTGDILGAAQQLAEAAILAALAGAAA